MRGGLDGALEALMGKARAAVRAGDLELAERLARDALARAPERASAYNVLAAIRELAGDWPRAMGLLRAGLAVEPTYAPARANLRRLGSYPEHGAIALGDEEP